MSWIETIPFDEAEGELKKTYRRVAGPDGNVDNILMAHSLRPHTLTAHMHLYKGVLHHTANTLPKYMLECIGVYVSHLNRCSYCIEHHFEGLQRLLNDESRAQQIKHALECADPALAFEGKEFAIMEYAGLLTTRPYDVNEEKIAELRTAGCTDGEILEVNQVAAYFSYANRTVLGLGVNTEGDILGLSPNSDSPDAWGHQNYE